MASRFRKSKETWKLMRRNWTLYLLLLPALAYVIIFHYWPMYGVQIAFRNFNFVDGITGSEWVGLKWFRFFFKSPYCWTVISNTFLLSLYALLGSFPFAILLALLIHNTPSKGFSRLSQTATYLPHFISTVVMVGMLNNFLSPNSGFINTMIEMLGGQRTYFVGKPEYFRHLYVWSGVWQGSGWNSIVYIAALTAISSELHEAAMIDGASKLQRIWHIDLPGIMPTMIILLILRCGNLLTVGFEKVYLMQNDLNLDVSEMISTYTYKQGLLKTKYSYSAAIGLFNNAINFAFLTIVNGLSKRLTETSLW